MYTGPDLSGWLAGDEALEETPASGRNQKAAGYPRAGFSRASHNFIAAHATGAGADAGDELITIPLRNMQPAPRPQPSCCIWPTISPASSSASTTSPEQLPPGCPCWPSGCSLSTGQASSKRLRPNASCPTVSITFSQSSQSSLSSLEAALETEEPASDSRSIST